MSTIVDRAIDWQALVRAVADDDIDAAFSQGLLEWDGDVEAPRRAGLDAAMIDLIGAARRARVVALAARERHRERDARLVRIQAERRRRQAEALAGVAGKPALPDAAAAALSRALAKARR